MKTLTLFSTLAACVLLTGCNTTSIAVRAPQLSVAPSLPRATTWREVKIRKEAADKYSMTKKSRDNLHSNLSDINRYVGQQRGVIDYYRNKDGADDATPTQ